MALKTVKAGDRRDALDARACMEVYGPSLILCAGGRLVVNGYVCPHCNSDNPPTECNQPAV